MHDWGVTDGEAWRELAQRLLDHGYRGGPETGVQVVLGDLPSEVAGLIQIPPGWRIVGSSLRRIDLGHPAQMVDVVIDAHGAPAAAVDDFAAAAEAAGWRSHEDERPMQGGFVPGSGAGEMRSFEQGELLLRVVALQRSGTSLDIRVHCNTEELPRWRQAPHGIPEAAAHMPQLRAPHGTRLSPRGGGGSGDHYQSDATIDGQVAVADLHAHFATQLEGARWQLINQGGDDRAAWSAWQLPDQRWQGLLMVLNPSGSQRTALLLRVESSDEGHEGGMSFATLASFR